MAKPIFAPDGTVLGPVPRNIMDDPRFQPTVREALTLGVGKAHRSVVYAHMDFRNFMRSRLGTTGKLE